MDMYGSWVWIARASGYGWEPYILICSHIFDPIDLRLDIPSACKQIHPIVLGIELLTKESSAGTVWHQLIQVPQSKASVVVGRHHLACPTAFFTDVQLLEDSGIIIKTCVAILVIPALFAILVARI